MQRWHESNTEQETDLKEQKTERDMRIQTSSMKHHI